MARKDLLTRLADAGEEAIARLAESPGADRVVGYATAMRDRVDELQKKVRGIDELEKRVAELERKLEAVSAGGTRARTARPAGATSSRSRAKPSTAASGATTRKSTAGKAGAKATRPAGSTSKRPGSTGPTGGTSPG